MDWNVEVVPEHVRNIGVFNELLGKLRAVHEEVCARNALLELQVAHVGTQSFHESKANDPWLPINFMPPKDSPAHRCLPWTTGNGHQRAITPRVFEVTATDILARQQECLCQNIEDLTKQQESLGHQISQALAVRQAPRMSNRRVTHRISTINGLPPRVSQAAPKSAVKPMRASTSSNQSTETTKQRFKVKTGNTKDFAGLSNAALGTERAARESRRVAAWRLCLRHMLHSNTFSIASSVLILGYAILIAVETDMIASDPNGDSFTIKCCHYVFTIIFSLELLLRCCAYGWSTWCGHDAFWNRLDAFLILSGVSEMFMENAMGSAKSAGSVMRGVRIGRVIRTVRLIRTFRQFHDFQKMAYALISSFRTLICSLALLIFVMFFFAVWLTQSAADPEMRDQITDLELRYGSLMSTMYTLFLSVSNGISWDACFMPLHKLSWATAQIFVLYVVIVLFGVLNVVTSVFVESVIRSVQHHKDLIVQDKEEEKTIAMAHMREVFRQVDQDGSGQVSIDELDFFLQDPALRKYMEALSIEAEDTRLLFRLLDNDDSGSISVEEFCEGCLRLKGMARSIDIHILTFRIANFLEKWVEFTGYVEDALSLIHAKCAV